MKRNTQYRSFGKLFALIGLAALLLAPMRSGAQYDVSPRVMALLPEYCKYTQGYRGTVPGGNDPEKIREWTAIMGEMFGYMHHYCNGLTHVNFAKFWSNSKRERDYQLQQAILEWDYMINKMQPGEKQLPDFHTRKGESLLALGKAAPAIAEFEQAIAMKADYWPPYANISDYFKDIGNIKMARETLERGLAASPDAKPLTRRLAELEGVKDKPKAVAESPKKAAAPEQRTQKNAPQSDQPTETPQAPATR
jgi:tetratricopeptide (TPR) repeat protein